MSGGGAGAVLPGVPPPPPPPPPADDPEDVDLVFGDAFLAEIGLLNEALTYRGFNPRAFRTAVLNKFKTKEGIAPNVELTNVQFAKLSKQIVKCLTAYNKVGNAPSKVATSVMDPALAASATAACSQLDVVAKAATGDGITLARMAVALMPVTLVLRNQLKSPKRFDGALPGWAQDCCFRGCNNIRGLAGYTEFITKWDAAMSKSRGFRKNETNWQEVADLGYSGDTVLVAHMDRVYATLADAAAFAVERRNMFKTIRALLMNEAVIGAVAV